MNIGTLTIEMAANVAKLQKDMADSKAVVSSAMKDIETAVNAAKTAFIAMTGVASIGAFQNLVLSSIEGVAKLHELSIQAGITVEALSALGAVGKATGTGADTIAAASNKLSKALASANEDSKGAATALKALGLSFDDFQKMSPDERMQKVAIAMGGFQDGGQKSAAAMLLFGKAGAELLPFLKDLAAAGELHAKVTTEQGEAAHELEVNLARLKTNGDAWKKSLSMELIPALNDFLEIMLSVKKSTKDTGSSIGEYLAVGVRWASASLNSLITLLKEFQLAMGAISAIMLNPYTMSKNIFDNWMADAKKLRDDTHNENEILLGHLTSSDKAGAGRGGTSKTDPRSLGVGEDFKPQVSGLNGSAAGTPKDPQVNEGLQLLNSLKTKYEQLTGTVSEYMQVERQLAAMKVPVDDARKKEILTVAAQIEKEVQAAATKKQLIAYDVEQANKQADQNKVLQDYVTAGNDARASIIAQTDALGLSSDELVRHNAMLQIDTVLKKAMVGATSETRQELEKLAVTMKGGVSEALDALKEKQDALNADWTVGAQSALDAYLKQVNNVAGSMQNVFTNAFKGMEDALVNFTKTGKLDFSSLADSIISDLIRIQIQKSITGPLAAAVKESFGGFFADGGSPPVGVPSIVGEKGPELFIPNTAGTIVPNHALGGGGVTVNQPVVINANNASAETVGQIRALMPGFMAENRRVIVSVVQQAMAARGGRMTA